MRKDSAFLVSTVSQVSQALKTDPLKQLASLDALSASSDAREKMPFITACSGLVIFSLLSVCA